MNRESNEPTSNLPIERWAQFRFSVIGTLLSSPPAKGQLKCQLEELANKIWQHPISGEYCTFAFSTIERWYYQALNSGPKHGPVDVLKRKVRRDHGHHRSINSKLAAAIANQYRDHPGWSYQLHHDNLLALIEQQPELVSPPASAPSYATVRRYMKSHGYIKRRRRGPANSPGARVAETRFESREIRSYESEYTNALWHLDFHHGSMRVLHPGGKWIYPLLLGILDDHSRLCCHMQWYPAEGARELCHGLSQAFLKRDLPRAILFDNGAAMIAKETVQGLNRLSIVVENTLPYSPYQNGKQESWWNQIEGRLLPMLEGEEESELTLERLNYISQAWVELEYNKKRHSSTNRTPLQRYCEDKDVARPSPAPDKLTEAFTAAHTRTQRRSDGTISLQNVRFEIPARYSHIEKLELRSAAWDLSRAWLCDPKTGAILCRIHPQDKVKNAEGRRARRSSPGPDSDTGSLQEPAKPVRSPLLEKILLDYAATGLPPAYEPGPESGETDDLN